MIQSQEEKREQRRKNAVERAKRIRAEREKSGQWVPIDQIFSEIDERRESR